MQSLVAAQQLLAQLSEFLEEMPGDSSVDLAAFHRWALARGVTQAAPGADESAAEGLEGVIAQRIGTLGRYASRYIKRLGGEMSDMNEFGYLAYLREVGELTKTQLIERNIHEKTTGTEIIRRLLHKGLVREYPNPHDQRSKLLALTPAGIAHFDRHLDTIYAIAQLVCGPLDAQEKYTLMALLDKLDHYHWDLHQRGEPLVLGA